MRNTKFYKSRLVPIGPRLTLELANYVEQRGALALPEGRDSALLCSRTGHRLTYQSPDTVRAFLEYVEHERGCGVVTRNQRLSAIHSLARFIGTRSPEHLAWCTEVRSIPFKKAAKTVIGYLEKLEMEALLRAPDQRTCLGARDHVLLLFL